MASTNISSESLDRTFSLPARALPDSFTAMFSSVLITHPPAAPGPVADRWITVGSAVRSGL